MAYKNNYIEGQMIGELTFLRRIVDLKDPTAVFKCVCGKEFNCRIYSIIKGITKSCGCMSKLLNRETNKNLRSSNLIRKNAELSEITGQIEKAFWDKVNKTDNNDECWNWVGNAHPRGYGKMNIKGVTVLSTRVSYYINTGIDPIGSVILHTCDNPKCVNPSHLLMGSLKDNSNDMIRKGRGKKQFKDGEKHPNAILTKEIISLIKKGREQGKTQSELGTEYGVRQSTISRILGNKRWKSLNKLNAN